MIENGGKQPNFETIWRIANAFDMLPHELVRIIEIKSKTTDFPGKTGELSEKESKK